MIKLFVTDLDGTFLNGLHVTSHLGKQVIQQVLNDHKHFAIATGRHLHGNHQVGLSFLHQPIYKIGMNGAIIWDTTNEVVYEQPIALEMIKQLKEQFPTVSFEWITKDGVFIERTRLQHWRLMLKKWANLKAIVKYTLGLFAKDYYFNARINSQQEILMIAARIGDTTLAQEVKNFIANNGQFIVDFGPSVHHFEVVASGVNKQTATSWLTAALEITEDEVAVYGNDLNDVPMLTHFEHSYATQNAVPLAKQTAKHVIGSNKQDGVAIHIMKTLKDSYEK